MSIQSILALQDEITKIQKEIQKLVRQTYPMGTVVTVRLGNALVTGPVVGHTRWYWSNPDEFFIQNERTGKTRKVNCYDMRKMVQESLSAQGDDT